MRVLAAAAMAVVLVGCGQPDGADDPQLTVFAAASLTDVLTELAPAFEEQYDVEVRLSFGGSADLAEQIRAGAPADVFVSADAATMERVADLVDTPLTVATNTLTLITPRGNPAGVDGLHDLAGADLVVCAEQVPCGAAAHALATAAGVTLEPVSEEQSVTDVLGRVAAGEADAGLVYVTDLARAPEPVQAIAIPETSSVVNHYPAAAVTGSPDGAQDFVDLLLGPEGQAAFEAAGFGTP